MNKKSLSEKGLSLSQAQSISNLCFQRSRNIDSKLNSINNYSRKVKIGDTDHVETDPNPMPSDISELLVQKAKLHATQAFLMENIKAKDELINSIKSETFVEPNTRPEYPELVDAEFLNQVGEKWGIDQLTISEYNEYLEAEAYASHIGQFIHKGGILDRLRNELPNLKKLDWIEINSGEKTPVIITPHHTSDQLLEIHEELAKKHRDYEQRVNYFKAKIKNLVTIENSRIAKLNADAQNKANLENGVLLNKYEELFREWSGEVKKLSQEFEAERQEKIKQAVVLRIDVDARFKDIVDMFMVNEQ